MTNLSARLKDFRPNIRKIEFKMKVVVGFRLNENYINSCKDSYFTQEQYVNYRAVIRAIKSMNEKSDLNGLSEEESADFTAFQEKVRGSNINEQTLLATDYLNHFNEIVMLLEMVPDMPEILDDAKEWQPRGYPEHMLQSTFSDRELAAEAYEHVPTKFRGPFEQTVSQIDKLIATSIERLEGDLERGDENLLRENAVALCQVIQRLMDVASGIINGSASTMDQSEIDNLIG